MISQMIHKIIIGYNAVNIEDAANRGGLMAAISLNMHTHSTLRKEQELVEKEQMDGKGNSTSANILQRKCTVMYQCCWSVPRPDPSTPSAS